MATSAPSGRLYSLVADLGVVIDGYTWEQRSREFGSAFTRTTTVIHLSGGGQLGVGEDVTPFEPAQHSFADAAGELSLGGRFTLASFAAHLDGLSLYDPRGLPPGFPRTFRRWALESAALDLALRQAGISLAEALNREPRPVRFVNSLSLGERGAAAVHSRLELYPKLRFKLDPAADWSDELMRDLAATDAVDIIDLKGQYPPQAPIALAPDAGLYERIAAAFPQAWLEDPGLTPETRQALEPHFGRVSWDLPIVTVADVDSLPIRPRAINIKPARHGTLRRLLEVLEESARRGIPTYGGGMGELGPGREQNQYLAAIFSPDAPNDVAPVAYNDAELAPGLPDSPLRVRPAAAGFGVSM